MRRLLYLLLIITFGVSHGIAAPFALCQHADSSAHEAALHSSDFATTAVAHIEDSAQSASTDGTVADAAAAAMAGLLLPAAQAVPLPFRDESLSLLPAAMAGLTDRATAPLLDPPTR